MGVTGPRHNRRGSESWEVLALPLELQSFQGFPAWMWTVVPGWTHRQGIFKLWENQKNIPLKSKLDKTKSFPCVLELNRPFTESETWRELGMKVKGLYHQRLQREQQKQWNQHMSESSVPSAPLTKQKPHEIWGERMCLGMLFDHHVTSLISSIWGTTLGAEERCGGRKERQAE